MTNSESIKAGIQILLYGKQLSKHKRRKDNGYIVSNSGSETFRIGKLSLQLRKYFRNSYPDIYIVNNKKTAYRKYKKIKYDKNDPNINLFLFLIRHFFGENVYEGWSK